jgi:hypothetical protein
MNELIKFIQKPEKKEEIPYVKEDLADGTWIFKEGKKDRFGDEQPITNDAILGPGHYPSNQFYSIE